jgi:hypothetical protein
MCEAQHAIQAAMKMQGSTWSERWGLRSIST